MGVALTPSIYGFSISSNVQLINDPLGYTSLTTEYPTFFGIPFIVNRVELLKNGIYSVNLMVTGYTPQYFPSAPTQFGLFIAVGPDVVSPARLLFGPFYVQNSTGEEGFAARYTSTSATLTFRALANEVVWGFIGNDNSDVNHGFLLAAPSVQTSETLFGVVTSINVLYLAP